MATSHVWLWGEKLSAIPMNVIEIEKTNVL
jgi:hypothetical protein